MLKNITLSADESVIKKAREKAQNNKTSLNNLFREWMNKYIMKENAAENYDQLMKSLHSVHSGRRFTREELHER